MTISFYVLINYQHNMLKIVLVVKGSLCVSDS
jgi:hypothetical protein